MLWSDRSPGRDGIRPYFELQDTLFACPPSGFMATGLLPFDLYILAGLLSLRSLAVHAVLILWGVAALASAGLLGLHTSLSHGHCQARDCCRRRSLQAMAGRRRGSWGSSQAITSRQTVGKHGRRPWDRRRPGVVARSPEVSLGSRAAEWLRWGPDWSRRQGPMGLSQRLSYGGREMVAKRGGINVPKFECLWTGRVLGLLDPGEASSIWMPRSSQTLREGSGVGFIYGTCASESCGRTVHSEAHAWQCVIPWRWARSKEWHQNLAFAEMCLGHKVVRSFLIQACRCVR